MRKTKQQIKNLKEALVWWQTVPEKNVDLNSWVDEGTPPYTCNTIACFGGWCAVYPSLVAQGVYPARGSGAPIVDGCREASQVAYHLFGDARMFLPRLCGHPADPRKGSDHKSVTARLKYALRHPKQASW